MTKDQRTQAQTIREAVQTKGYANDLQLHQLLTSGNEMEKYIQELEGYCIKIGEQLGIPFPLE